MSRKRIGILTNQRPGGCFIGSRWNLESMVLEGGLKEWRELGLPVTTELSSPAEVAVVSGLSSQNEIAYTRSCGA